MMPDDVYPFIVTPLGAQQGGGFKIQFPDFLGFGESYGTTVDEAVENGMKAKAGWIDVLTKAGLLLPLPHSFVLLPPAAMGALMTLVQKPRRGRGRPSRTLAYEDKAILGLLHHEMACRPGDDAKAIARHVLECLRAGENVLEEKPLNFGPDHHQTIERWARHIRDFRKNKGPLFVSEGDAI
jgi:predicted RNase H-like HicB family nuclease